MEWKAEEAGGVEVAELAEADAAGDGEEVTGGTREDGRDCIFLGVQRTFQCVLARSGKKIIFASKYSASCIFTVKYARPDPKRG